MTILLQSNDKILIILIIYYSVLNIVKLLTINMWSISAEGGRRSLFKKKILVVDDSDFFAAVIGRALTQDGYDVVRAACGEVGLRLVREEKPDLVLLDVVMPGLNGF